MSVKYFNIIIKVIIAISVSLQLSSCSNGRNTTPSSATPLNLVTGLANGEVFKNGKLLSGSGSVILSGEVIALAFESNNNLLVATGNIYTPNKDNNQWQLVNTLVPNGFLAFSILSTNNGNLYIGANNYSASNSFGTVFESVAGAWIAVNSEAMPDNDIVTGIANDSNNNLFSSTESNVFKSIASAWVAVNNQPLPTTLSITHLIINKYNQIFVAVTDNNSDISSAYTLASGSWQQVGGGLIPDNSKITSMVTDHEGNLIVSTFAGDIYELLLNGSNWLLLNPSNNFGITDAIAVDSNNNLYVTNITSSIYEYTNGSWAQASTQVPDGGPIFSLMVNENNELIAGTKMGGVYQLNNGNWQAIVYGAIEDNSAVFSLNSDTSGTIFASVYNESSHIGSVYAWQNGKWGAINNESILTGFVPISINFDINDTLYAGGFDIGEEYGKVYYSNNGAWYLVNEEPLPESARLGQILTNKNNQLFAAASYMDSGWGGVYESVAGSWSLVNNESLPVEIGVIAYNNKKNTLYAGNGGIWLADGTEEAAYVYESQAGRWIIVNGGPLPNNRILMAITNNNQGNLFVGTISENNIPLPFNGAIFESVNGSWSPVGPNLPDYSGGVVAMMFVNNILYVQSYFGNVYALINNEWVLQYNYQGNIAFSMINVSN